MLLSLLEQIKEGVYVVFMTNPHKLAKIKEISEGGLTVRYFDSDEGSNDSFELDILDWYIEQIAFITESAS